MLENMAAELAGGDFFSSDPGSGEFYLAPGSEPMLLNAEGSVLFPADWTAEQRAKWRSAKGLPPASR